MSLGLCCQWLSQDKKGRWKNTLVSKTYRFGRFQQGLYSDEDIKNLYLTNVQCLLNHLPKIHKAGIRVFRMSSSMFAFFDKVPSEFYDNDDLKSRLKQCGEFILSHNMRFTTHPDQFAVLSSDDKDVVSNAVSFINFHAWIFDQMGLPESPYYAINVHGGKKDRLQNLIHGIHKLQDSARKRLTLENCEYGYNVKQLELASKETGVPICFDSHHHRFNTGGESGEDAMWRALDTWPDNARPLTHLSNTHEDFILSEKTRDLRKHSNYIYMVPDYQKEANNEGFIDVDIEAKMKQLSINSAVNLGLLLQS